MALAQEIPLGVGEAIAVGIGVVIPFIVATVTRYNAPLWVKSLVSLLSAGTAAVVLWLTEVPGVHTWKGLLTAFILAVVTAGATKSAVTGGLDTKLARKTPTFGIGAPKLDAESAAVVKASAKRHP